jgi:hypothetical protein
MAIKRVIPAMSVGELKQIVLGIHDRFDDHLVILNMPIFDKDDLETPEKYEEVPLSDFLHIEDEYELHLFGEV